MKTFLCSIVTLLLAAAIGRAENMDRYRGVNNSGYYSAVALMRSWPQGGPKLLWSADPGPGWSNVAVVNDNVYAVGGWTAMLHVYDLDGKPLDTMTVGSATWKRFGGSRTTPMVHAGVAAVGLPNGGLRGIDLLTGESRWLLNAWKDFGSGKGGQGWGWSETPMRHENLLIFSPCSRDPQTPGIVAIDIRNGSTVWAVPGRPADKSSPSGKPDRYSATDLSGALFVHNGRAIVAYPTFVYLSGIDAETGKVLWELPSESSKSHTPIYGDGRLLWGPANNMEMLELNADGSAVKQLWTRPGWAGWSGGAMFGGRVYAIGSATAESVKGSGASAASIEAESDEPAAARKPTGKGGTALLCLDAETGNLISTLPHNGQGNVIAGDGMLYVTELLNHTTLRVHLVHPGKTDMTVTGVMDIVTDKNTQNGAHWMISPALAKGRLYVRFGEFKVFDVSAEPPSIGWRHDGAGFAETANPPLPWSKIIHRRWTADVTGGSLVMDRRHAVSAGADAITCIDVDNGKVVWRHKKGGVATPVISGDAVFAPFGSGTLAKLNMADGKPVWTSKAEGQPLLVGNVVVAQGKSLVGLDAGSGNQIWQHPVPRGAYGVPAKLWHEGTGYIVTSWGSMIRAHDGVIEKKELPVVPRGDVVVRDGVVYICGESLVALTFNGKLWEADLKTAAAGVVHDGWMYVPTTKPSLVALDARSGKLSGELKLKEPVTGPLTLAGGALYVPGAATTVVVSAEPTLRTLWELNAPDGVALAFYQDRVTALSGGKLQCFAGRIAAAPVEPATDAVAASNVATWPNGLPLTPFASDECPPQWLWAAPMPGFDLKTDFMSALGGRENTSPGLGTSFKVGDASYSFQMLTTNHIWQSKYSGGFPVIDLTAVHGRKYQTTGLYVTGIENDRERWVRFATLLKDSTHWRERFDFRAWLSGRPIDETTVFKLDKGRHVLLIQAGMGECEEWGKIFMYPRLIDVSDETEKRFARHKAEQVQWQRYQTEEAGKPFVLP
jgi:outer membrane protein assembly factor BamB